MKIGFFDIEDWEKKSLKKAFPRDKLVFSSEKLTSKNAGKYKNLEVISVFIYSKINEEILNKLPKLKLIATRSTGFDHIDLATCKKKGITVCNVPAYGENTVAEHVFALILGLSRKIVGCVERTTSGSFDLTGLRGFDLKGKTLGVVGCGNIGQCVIRMAKGFEMDVLVFDVYKVPRLAKKIGFRYAGMDKLIKESDIITLHVPLNKHTHHLIDGKKISKMKKGAYVINTSRGEIIDTNALFKGLKSSRIAGAGLDVLEEECAMAEEKQLLSKHFKKECNLGVIAKNHKLLKMPNVLVTPHNAFNTHEALMRILETTIGNIKGFKKGKKICLVSRE